jgi:hypothetical protein
MPQETTEILTAEEREVVDFFKGLIPILKDAFADLKRRNLLDEDFLGTKKNS